MALAKVKTNGMGKGKRRWVTRYEAKSAARKRRRREDRTCPTSTE